METFLMTCIGIILMCILSLCVLGFVAITVFMWHLFLDWRRS